MSRPPVPGDVGDDGGPDIGPLGRRLWTAATILGGLALVAVVVDSLFLSEGGLSFGVMARWGGAGLALFVLVAAALVGLHAYRGADAAQRRGERLAGDDVGLLPGRRRSRHRS